MAAVVCVVLGVAPVLALTTAAGARVRTRTAPAITSYALTLASQSPTVVKPGQTLHLTVDIQAPIPESELGLQLYLYPQVQAFTDFMPGPRAQFTPYPSQGSIAVGSATTGTTSTTSRLAVTINNVTTTPIKPGHLSLDLGSGEGVYPLGVELVNRTHDDQVDVSFVTDIVLVPPSTNDEPLRVALVLPVGTENVFTAPLRTPVLPPNVLSSLSATTTALATHRRTDVSLDLYPQLLAALGAAAKSPVAAARLGALKSVVSRGSTTGSVELLTTPFTPVNPSTLASSGLGADFDTQIERSAQSLETNFLSDAPPADSPYVVQGPLTPAGLALIERAGINEIALPAGDAHLTLSFLETSPFSLLANANSPAAAAPLAVASYSQLNSLLSDPPANDPVLAANQLLAELATIYFENPSLSQPRGIAVTPQSLPDNGLELKALLDTLLNGLASNPILSATTLHGLFTDVPVGADAPPWNQSSAPLDPNGKVATLPGKQITTGHRDLTLYSQIAPTDSAHVSRLKDELLLSEGSLISDSARANDIAAATGLLQSVGAHLRVTSTKSVTLTARQGSIPYTIRSTWTKPITLALHLSSAEGALTFPSATTRSTCHLVITLSPDSDNQECVAVAARTSGAFALNLKLVAAPGTTALLATTISVNSTAISSAVIGLSIAALVVLLGWWVRSIRRSRRKKAHAHLAGALPTE